MSWCMPMIEAKQFISSGPFDVKSFVTDADGVRAMIQNTVSEALYLVQYLTTMQGEIACFAPLLGGQGV